MSRVFQTEQFTRYNGFYGRPYCRRVVLHLYGGKCATCNRAIDGEGFHVAHIIPRSHPDMMERYFPGLDVDNLLNLKLSCPPCNQRESNFVLDGLLLQGAFNCSARVISTRLASALDQQQAMAQPIRLSGTDPKICTDVLHIDVDEIRRFASEWQGAVVMPAANLDARVRDAIRDALGDDPGNMAVYYAVEESISHFRNHLKIDGNSYSAVSTGDLPWLVEAYKRLQGAGGGGPSLGASIQAAGFIDGIYVDPEELNKRGGVFIPLRTESQRWFLKVFATLVRMTRKLEANLHERYFALSENDWRSINDCFDSLSLIEPCIRKAERRLKAPHIVTSFALCSGELRFGGGEVELPHKVRLMCQAVATDSIWGEGALAHKSKLKSWLARAFSLADQAVQIVTGPHLIRIGDERTGYRWVPPLPTLKGKTRDEVRLEAMPPKARRGSRRRDGNRHRSSVATATPPTV